MGSVILKKGEITLYSQKTESRNTNLKLSSMDFFLETKGLTHFIKVIGYAKSERTIFES